MPFPPLPPPVTRPALGAVQAPTQRAVLAMGTTLTLSVRGSSKGVEAALAAAADLEARCSTWRPESLWSRFNAGEPVALPEVDQALLRRVLTLSKGTEGCFDPVLGRLIQAWGLRAGGQVPSEESLEVARAASGRAHLQEGPGGLHLTEGAWLEEGGFLKGHALDLLRLKLEEGGAIAGLLDFGGQLLAWGPAQSVSLADPRDRRRPCLSFRLRNASVSTSGTSERGRHLLDPRTGRPCPAWGSVAVVRPTGLEADLLSTALYVMGPDRGLAWADAHGIAAAFLLNDGPAHFTGPFRALHPRTR
ncbi:MAG TPA: FAD:protein FMN transferase [Holophagaceae bacterium]|nr:FAD:protein FMN transferase [Holophagaceae bacterium]